jgi:hypothetical protein
MRTADPKSRAMADDLRRLGWVVLLVWLALAVFSSIIQRFLGWRLAIGLIGGAGVLFTLGLLLVASGAFAASSADRWWNKL